MLRSDPVDDRPVPDRSVVRSIASAVAVAAKQLVSTASGEPDAEVRRRIGAALLECEPTGCFTTPDQNHKPYRRWLTVELSFYDSETRDVVAEHEELASDALGSVMFGWAAGIQLLVRMLDVDLWRPALYPVGRSSHLHLHRFMRPEVVRDDPRRCIVLRRFRYRLGHDHSSKGDSQDDLLMWSTPTTVTWARSLQQDQDRLNRLADDVAQLAVDRPANTDWGFADPDDWGAVDLERDPLRVAVVTTRTGITRTEVDTLLAAADDRLQLVERPTARSDRQRPIAVFIDELRRLSRDILNGDSFDVVLVHRGGGVAVAGDDVNVDARDREALLEAVLALRDQGTEVILGIGHGRDALLPPRGDGEVGIFEATTPTAAAAWLVQEHVHSGLADYTLALRQNKPPQE
ncbi:MAG: hypothetical protein V4737_01650 [Curtobacterium sp.]